MTDEPLDDPLVLFIMGWTLMPDEPKRLIPPRQLAYPILGGEAFLPADAATLQRLLGSERSSISVPHKESVNDAPN